MGLVEDCEVPAPEAAACLDLGPAASDFCFGSTPLDADFPALALAALASTSDLGVRTTAG